MPLDLFDEFRALTAALEEQKVEYAVIGALALAVHGVPRATTDIDVMVRPEDVDRVLEIAGTLGFALPAAPMTFSASGVSIRRVSKVEEGELLTLDILLVNQKLDEVWNTRTRVTTEHGPIRVISRNGLIKMKALSGRLQDLADIQRLQGDENG